MTAMTIDLTDELLPCPWCFDDLRDGSHAECPGAPDYEGPDLRETR